MIRTTEKYTHYEEYMSNVPEEAHHAINAVIYEELYKLENIEEELGIELEVLFSALKNGVYYFDEQGQLIHDYVYLTSNFMDVGVHEKLSFSFLTYSTRQTLLFENYGKTWSLNKKSFERKESKMKILNNKEQNKLIEKIMELNSFIANSNIDLEAFDLLGDIMSLALDMRHTIRVKDALIEELKNKGTKE